MVKLQEIKNRFFITLPKEHVKKFDWKKGQELYIAPVGLGEKKLVIEEMKSE